MEERRSRGNSLSISTGTRTPKLRHKSWHRRSLIIGLCLFVSLTIHSTTIVWVLPESQFHACGGFDGILHISQGDSEGAAGTIFFLFVLNQLMYAQKYNLIPWVHLTNASHHIYDFAVHGSMRPQTIVVNGILQPTWLRHPDSLAQKALGYPGPPPPKPLVGSLTHYTISGNGVWNNYFAPVSQYSPTDPSCQQLPLIRLSYAQIIPGLHLHCPWAIRAWRYGGLPPSLRNDTVSYEEWFRPQRRRGRAVVQKFVKLLPPIHKLARNANPSPHCLAVHIRHSDKANRRKRIPIQIFVPYMEEYWEQVPEGTVYLATDSSHVVQALQSRPRLHWQNHIKRSNDTTAIFRQFPHHETNMQVLVDIQAMAYCQYLLHGFSAVSEAVMYLNPALQNVNLEVPKPVSRKVFRKLLQEQNN